MWNTEIYDKTMNEALTTIELKGADLALLYNCLAMILDDISPENMSESYIRLEGYLWDQINSLSDKVVEELGYNIEEGDEEA
jgi:hypothetical protein